MQNLKYILIIGLVFLFSGCSTLTFNNEYVQGNIENNLTKVSANTQIIIDKKEPFILEKRPNSIRGALSKLSIDLNSVNEGVLSKFFSQYFSNIIVSNENEKGIFIDSSVTNYEYEYGLIKTVEMEVFVDIKVYLNGTIILNKSYKSDKDKVNALISLTRISGGSYADELFHKSLLNIYENKFKPDLLKALKENI